MEPKILISNLYVFCFSIFIVGAISSISFISFLRFLDKKYNKKLEHQASIKRSSVFIAYGISWCFSFSLGCVFVVGMSEAEHNKEIFNIAWQLEAILMMMYPVGLALCTFAAALATPLATRAIRTGTRNLILFGSLFWILLACYIFWAPSFNNDGIAIFGGFLLIVIGLIIIGQIPPKTAK